MLTSQQIRDIARRQRLRGVQVVGVRIGDDSVRIRVGATPTVATPAAAPPAPTTVAVRATALGLAVLPQALRIGDRIAAGQLLAAIDFDGCTTPVHATTAGALAAVCVRAGQRVDHGMTLFELNLDA